MANYICNCLDHEESKSGITIKMVDNRAVYDIKCPCGKYMEVKDPKLGVPSLGKMDKYGRSY